MTERTLAIQFPKADSDYGFPVRQPAQSEYGDSAEASSVAIAAII